MFKHICCNVRYIYTIKTNTTMKKIYALAAALLIAGASFAQSTWSIDKTHSKVGFSVAHMAVSETEGKFNDFEGTVVSKSDDFNGAEVSFNAKVASIDTDNENRDGHLKSADFFDAAKYADVTFKGNIAKAGAKYTLKGDFTMKGVTKKVEFDVTYGGTINTGKGFKAGFKLVGKINRQDYGLTYGGKLSTGELTIGDIVEVVAKIELDKK
jgi:polyisoprenoid-binding protein YceI